MSVWATLPTDRSSTSFISATGLQLADQYQYTHSMHLPAGTKVEMQYVYDNSADNPRNPNQPPKKVTFGSRRQ